MIMESMKTKNILTIEEYQRLGLLLLVLCISILLDSCSLLKVPQTEYNVEYDEIAFFTEDNKPDEYTDANPYSYSYMETTTEMDNGYNWAKEIMKKLFNAALFYVRLILPFRAKQGAGISFLHLDN